MIPLGYRAINNEEVLIDNFDNATHNVKIEITNSDNDLTYSNQLNIANIRNNSYYSYSFHINNSMLNKLKSPVIYNFSVSVDSNPPVYLLIEYNDPIPYDYLSLVIENSTPRISRRNIF